MEIWKDIKGFKGYYQASNLGKIRSVKRILWNGLVFYDKKGIILKACISSNGYKVVSLQIKGIAKTKTVHRLIAQSFIFNPENKPCVNHKNGTKADNKVDNLEWVTYKENMNHAHQTGIKIPVRGEKSGRSKLTEIKVIQIRNKYIPYEYHVPRLANEYKVSKTTIQNIIINKTWKHI